MASALILAGLVAVAPSPSEAAESQVGTISGTVTFPSGARKSATVSLYQQTDDGEWDEVNDASTNSSTGAWTVSLLPGTYRVGFNIPLSAETLPRQLDFEYYNGVQTINAAESIVVTAGSSRPGVNAALAYTGGTITGRVTDEQGHPLNLFSVGAHDPDEDYGDLEPKNVGSYNRVMTGADGRFTFRTRGVPLILHIDRENGGHVDEYYDDTQDWTQATRLNVAPGETVAINDIRLTSLAIKSVKAPRVSGDVFTGGRATVDAGEWSTPELTYSYQWYVVDGSKTSKISGATGKSYKIPSSRYGKRLQVAVKASRSGLSSVTKTSGSSAKIKRGSTVSFSGTSSSQKLKLSITVKVSGLSSPTGKARAKCGNGVVVLKTGTGTVKKGKASVTLSPLPKGSVRCEVTYSGPSTVASDSATKTITVK